MANASGSRQTVLYVPEQVRGTVPANPALKTARITSTTLALTKATMASAEIRSDRQISDFRHGIRSGSGDIATEISVGSHDDWLEAALGGTWSGTVNGSTLSAGLTPMKATWLS